MMNLYGSSQHAYISSLLSLPVNSDDTTSLPGFNNQFFYPFNENADLFCHTNHSRINLPFVANDSTCGSCGVLCSAILLDISLKTLEGTLKSLERNAGENCRVENSRIGASSSSISMSHIVSFADARVALNQYLDDFPTTTSNFSNNGNKKSDDEVFLKDSCSIFYTGDNRDKGLDSTICANEPSNADVPLSAPLLSNIGPDVSHSALSDTGNGTLTTTSQIDILKILASWALFQFVSGGRDSTSSCTDDVHYELYKELYQLLVAQSPIELGKVSSSEKLRSSSATLSSQVIKASSITAIMGGLYDVCTISNTRGRGNKDNRNQSCSSSDPQLTPSVNDREDGIVCPSGQKQHHGLESPSNTIKDNINHNSIIKSDECPSTNNVHHLPVPDLHERFPFTVSQQEAYRLSIDTLIDSIHNSYRNRRVVQTLEEDVFHHNCVNSNISASFNTEDHKRLLSLLHTERKKRRALEVQVKQLLRKNHTLNRENACMMDMLLFKPQFSSIRKPNFAKSYQSTDCDASNLEKPRKTPVNSSFIETTGVIKRQQVPTKASNGTVLQSVSSMSPLMEFMLDDGAVSKDTPKSHLIQKSDDMNEMRINSPEGNIEMNEQGTLLDSTVVAFKSVSELPAVEAPHISLNLRELSNSFRPDIVALATQQYRHSPTQQNYPQTRQTSVHVQDENVTPLYLQQRAIRDFAEAHLELVSHLYYTTVSLERASKELRKAKDDPKEYLFAHDLHNNL